MILEPIKQQELEEHFQIKIEIIGTKGALKEKGLYEYEIYNKEELLEALERLVPEEEFGYSILAITKEEDKGI